MPDFKTSGTTSGTPKVVSISDEEMAWRRDRVSQVKGPVFAKAKRIFLYRSPASASANVHDAWAKATGKVVVYSSGKGDADDLALLASCDAAVMSGPAIAKFTKMWGSRPKLKVIIAGGGLTDREVGKAALVVMAESIWVAYSMTE